MKPSLHEQYLRFSRNELKAEELESFLQQVTLAENQEMVKEWMDNTWNELAEINIDQKGEKKVEAPVVPISEPRRFHWKRWTAVASIIIVIGFGSYFLFSTKSGEQPAIVTTTPQDVKAPEINRAMITLADGRTVYLDSAANGELVQQGNIKLVKLSNGQIAYESASGEIIKDIQYNTLSNPRGSKVIDLVLSDGSRVWLNAGSSVTYPIAFVGTERKVSIDGEAYFDISHNASKPFKVAKGDVEITVLGTRFNVNAYNDEVDIKVTLLEGKVQVANTNSQFPDSQSLIPGQQAIVSGDAGIKKLSDADIEKIMAWKQNVFMFSGDDLTAIMRQLSRWYNIEVIYQQPAQDRHFTAIISRDNNISAVLKMLQATGKVDFKIKGQKVFVE